MTSRRWNCKKHCKLLLRSNERNKIYLIMVCQQISENMKYSRNWPIELEICINNDDIINVYLLSNLWWRSDARRYLFRNIYIKIGFVFLCDGCTYSWRYFRHLFEILNQQKYYFRAPHTNEEYSICINNVIHAIIRSRACTSSYCYYSRHCDWLYNRLTCI